MIGDQGPYDPTGFIEGDPSTYPVPLGGGYYYAGQYWTLTAAAVIGGDPLEVGDLLYVVSFGRAFGDGTFGDGFIGWNTNGPWDGIEVGFRGVSVSLPAWEVPAPPYSGCPLGESMPGWRIVIDAQYLPESAEVRRFGELDFGDELFGDDINLDVSTMPWNDITEQNFGVSITVGNTDGNPRVRVSEAQFDFIDETADLFAMSQPESWFGPRVGTIVRVGVLAPSLEYHPLFVGRIESVNDVHDQPPRLVQVDAFGMSFDTVQTLPDWTRPAETADVRLTAIGVASGYVWGPVYPYPSVPGPSLLALPEPENVVAREALDVAAISARWYVNTAKDGRLRVRPWPEPGGGQVITVTDCNDAGDTGQNRVVFGDINYLEDGDQVIYGDGAPTSNLGLLSPSVGLFGDMNELLNLVVINNKDDTP